ncbi:hypothetical protein MPH_08915 [Macrophomina phaseolina MS6]|uniref:Uncharacterized protein n=1 Tax=Macrophomina phaseolina (strain MS6) TaxID=1126212 RepID=K2QVZ3_MACPH|nr:hypothetical protein MPH_08915 [Macrophomina phaseolina MS6]
MAGMANVRRQRFLQRERVRVAHIADRPRGRAGRLRQPQLLRQPGLQQHAHARSDILASLARIRLGGHIQQLPGRAEAREQGEALPAEPEITHAAQRPLRHAALSDWDDGGMGPIAAATAERRRLHQGQRQEGQEGRPACAMEERGHVVSADQGEGRIHGGRVDAQGPIPHADKVSRGAGTQAAMDGQRRECRRPAI